MTSKLFRLFQRRWQSAPTGKQPRHRTQLNLEALERRVLMAGNVSKFVPIVTAPNGGWPGSAQITLDITVTPNQWTWDYNLLNINYQKTCPDDGVPPGGFVTCGTTGKYGQWIGEGLTQFDLWLPVIAHTSATVLSTSGWSWGWSQGAISWLPWVLNWTSTSSTGLLPGQNADFQFTTPPLAVANNGFAGAYGTVTNWHYVPGGAVFDTGTVTGTNLWVPTSTVTLTLDERLAGGIRPDVGTCHCPCSCTDGGVATAEPNTGATSVYQPLDPRLSQPSSQNDGFPGTNPEDMPAPGFQNGRDPVAGFGDEPGLVYDSNTVNVQPIGEMTVALGGGGAQFQIRSTWNKAAKPQNWTSLNYSNVPSGDAFVLGSQVSAPVSQTGAYPMMAEAERILTPTSPSSPSRIRYIALANLMVVANDTSPFGPGWTLVGLNRLVVFSTDPLNSYAMMVFGSGAPPRYYHGAGGSFQSPPDDHGTLVGNSDGTYTYTTPQQVRWNFDANGLMRTIVDPHGLTVTYNYNGGLLSSIAMPDGGVTTFNYDANHLVSSIVEPGNRSLTLRHDPATGNLLSITDVDGTLRTYTYDATHHLTNVQWGPLSTTYTYDQTTSVLTQVDRGNGTVFHINPANTKALAGGYGTSQVAGSFTDPLGHTTTYMMDMRGRATRMQTADGAVQTWQLDSHGQVTTYTDARTKVTTYAYDSAGDLLQVNYPDGSTRVFQYHPTFHLVTQARDGLGHVTNYGYDPATADLLTITDAMGQVTTMTWSNGLLQSVTDPLGNTTNYQYDSNRRLKTVTDAVGNPTNYTYDVNGFLATVKDARGNVTTLVNDARGRILQRLDAAGGTTIYVYNAIGEVTSITDPRGILATYAYDQHGWRTDVTAASGTPQQITTATTYDVAGNVLTVTDPRGIQTSYGYDAVNRPTEIIVALGKPEQQTTTMAYDQAGNLISETDGRGVTTAYTYDALNRPIKVVAASSYPSTIPTSGSFQKPTTTITYDKAGNVLSVTDADGVTTSYGYDADNRRTQVIEDWGKSDARTTTTVYDKAGNVLSVTDPRDVTTSYAYDKDNRLTKVIEAYSYPSTLPALNHASPITTIAYDAVGNVQYVTDPRGVMTAYVYDALNRLTQVTRNAGIIGPQPSTLISYDHDGNVTSKTDEGNVTTNYVYDALNRVTQVIEAAQFPSSYAPLNHPSPITQYAYDADNNVVQITDPLGNMTTYVYDSLNRQTQSIDPNGGVVTMAYDAANNLTVLTDPAGNTTAYTYDPLNRKIKETDPLGNITSYTYDALGLLQSVTDPLGRGEAFVYDSFHRLTTETWKTATGYVAQTLAYSYDADNNLLTASNANGKYTFTYDALNREVSVQEPFGAALTFTYDIGSNRTQVQDSFGGVTSSTYDALDRLTSRQFSGTGQTSLRVDLTYTSVDRFASINRSQGNGSGGWTSVVTSSYTYDALQRIVTLQHQNSSGATLANYVYTYDANSRLISETDTGRHTNYSYDKTGQLTADGTGVYSYDLNGNRTNPGYQTGTDNQLLTDGTWNYTYDKAGNLIKKTKIATGETWTYGYDNANHMTSAKDTAPDGHTVLSQVTYTYDVFGNRLEQDVWTAATGMVVTQYAYDGQDVWADLTGTNTLKTRYLRGDVVDQIFARESASGAVAWYLTDRLDSVRDITDANGVVQDHIDYDGFGNVITETNASFGDRYKYTGREFDSVTGLQYNRARSYDPKAGRWISKDPLEFLAGDSNLYRYADNSPTNGVDPTGLAWTISRDGNATALAIPGVGDTIRGLATQIGLNPSEFKAWLRNEPLIVNGNIGLDYVVTQEDVCYRRYRFEVPNTGYIDVAEHMRGALFGARWPSFLTATGVWRDAYARTWKKEGLKVIMTEPDELSEWDVVHHLRDSHLYKYVFIGHGRLVDLPNGSRELDGSIVAHDTAINPLGIPQYDETGKQTGLGRGTQYGIAEMGIYSCGSDIQRYNWKALVSPTGSLTTVDGTLGVLHTFVESRGRPFYPNPVLSTPK
jgi:RHS repeat-associated protein